MKENETLWQVERVAVEQHTARRTLRNTYATGFAARLALLV